ncbi:MAG: HAD-IIB family hydrolase [Desulfuromonadales bacterium]|nr:HAD-IIB family hydrolase [Desulfuromonadales bacterium]MBN2791476.1 HAD-IIB family hydrolase [Desulfuromonadales bacterium]
MLPLSHIDRTILKDIDTLLTDIDDTLTIDGKIPAVAYSAMEKLHSAGIRVLPVTGRPAGWCDHIARMWPVGGIIGENGAFYFHYQQHERRMIRRYWQPETVRRENRKKLSALADKILTAIPQARISADQAYRETDLAIDIREDVPPLQPKEITHIVQIFKSSGAQAKISSIHVNGWFGDYDKLAMTRIFLREVFKVEPEKHMGRILFVGDSPNDEPMFEYFPHSVGVANIVPFAEQMTFKPAWIAQREGGLGFAELAEALLKAKTLRGR